VVLTGALSVGSLIVFILYLGKMEKLVFEALDRLMEKQDQHRRRASPVNHPQGRRHLCFRHVTNNRGRSM
jgi:hypothetical protein